MKHALLSALAVSALLRAGYVALAADPCVSFVPDCALWSTRDGGCFATPAEFVHGRDGGTP